MKARLLIPLTLLLLLFACKKQETPGTSQLVVEGWIESGGHPIVTVSESIGIVTGKEMYPKDLLDHLAKWAKVSVSDGENTVILTGMADSQYFPPYIYTSSRITGEVGKTYSLRVEYKDYVATATATIPEPVPLDTVYVKSVSRDSLCHVMCGFTDPAPKGNYYKVFTKTKDVDAHYHPSAMATYSDDQIEGYTEVFLYSTQRLLDYIDMPNIHTGDVMWIKLCTMDQVSFRYWDNFEIMLASNFMGTYFENTLKANLTGGVGYWAGYGVDKEVKFTVTKPDD